VRADTLDEGASGKLRHNRLGDLVVPEAPAVDPVETNGKRGER
jgi:hypothetical protein